MGMENVRDAFDVWVIDPANGTVEQVDLEPATPAATIKPARKVASQPKPVKRRLAKTGQSKPRAAKKPRAPKTAKRIVKRAAGTKKLASIQRSVRPKKKRVSATVPALVATTPTSAPRKPRAKRVKPSAPTLPPALPAPGPAPLEPSVAAAVTGLAAAGPIDASESMMVLELRPTDRPTPRPGTIDIRFVDVHE